MARSEFGNAFAEARKAGKGEFEWKGKKYHTRTKEEEAGRKSKPAAKAAPSPAMKPKAPTPGAAGNTAPPRTGGASNDPRKLMARAKSPKESMGNKKMVVDDSVPKTVGPAVTGPRASGIVVGPGKLKPVQAPGLTAPSSPRWRGRNRVVDT